MKKQFNLFLTLLLAVTLVLSACQPSLPQATEEPVSTEIPIQQPADPPAAEAGNVTVTLNGSVWNDQCEAEPGTAPEPMPAGCVAGPLGAAQADGIRQDGELALSGVTVQVGLGECPSVGLAEAITDSLGAFSVLVSIPIDATLCVSVDAGADANAVILMDGKWTAPGDVAGLIAESEGAASDALFEFGWDFHSVGMSTLFKVSTEANCRSGPGTLYPVLAIIKPGDEFPIVGRNQDKSWFMLDMLNGILCWASIVTGETAGNTDGVQIVSVAPPPQQATAAPSSGSDSQPPACSTYTTQETCDPTRCDWFTISGRGSFCIDK